MGSRAVSVARSSYARDRVAPVADRISSTVGCSRWSWLACSFASNTVEGATNGIPDRNSQVLNCGRDRAFILATIDRLSKSNDAVVVTPHWGVEYELTARREQKELARAEAMLATDKFVASAPPAVVDGEREKLERFRRELEALSGTEG